MVMFVAAAPYALRDDGSLEFEFLATGNSIEEAVELAKQSPDLSDEMMIHVFELRARYKPTITVTVEAELVELH